jgi:hypothetical protein
MAIVPAAAASMVAVLVSALTGPALAAAPAGFSAVAALLAAAAVPFC